MQKKIDRHLYACRFIYSAFWISIAIFLFVCMGRNIWPFGDRTILKVDLFHQYAPYIEEVRCRILAGKSLVVFEKLYYGEEQICAHEDLKDKAQTVKVVKIKPAPETGDKNNLKLYLAIAMGSLLLGSCFVIEEARRKKKHKKEDEE